MAEYVVNKYRALFVRAKDLYNEEKYSDAVTLLELIIRNDETCYEGMFYLGNIYYHGLTGKFDYDRAFQLLTISALNKNMEATYLVGLCCLNGQGTAKDEYQAKSWFEIGAKNGHIGCQYYLGMSFYEGHGVNPNIHTALKCFLVAAKNNHTEAKYMAGRCYEKLGKFVAAATMYLAAAIDGHPKGCEVIADYYEEGKYVNKRPDLAVHFYEIGYKNKNYNCAYKLGMHYRYNGADADYNKAFHLFEDADKNGVVDAKYQIGLALYGGYGIDRDSRLAVKVLQSDDLKYHKDALRFLGDVFEFPNSPLLEEDPVQAKNYWMRAAELGESFSMYKLGRCYETGYGVLKINLRTAYKWYQMAADNGNEEAKIVLRKFRRTLTGKVKYRK